MACAFYLTVPYRYHISYRYRTVILTGFSGLLGTLDMLLGRVPIKIHRAAFAVWRQSSTKRAEFDKYCLDQVKNHDHSGYLGGLLLPKEYRGVYYALHAYNIEIATIRDNIPRNSIQAGRIRFQFWRDTLQHMYSAQGLPASNNQPVVQALDFYSKKYSLTSRWFERALEARFRDMMGSAELENMDDLENVAEYSQSSLLYLLLEAFGVHGEDIEYTASHVGVCKGIVTLLRGHEVHRRQNVCYFPKEVMQKHGLTLSSALNGPASPEEATALQDTIHDIASQAYAHLTKARELMAKGTLPQNAHYALMPAVECSLYLDRLEQNGFAPIPFGSDPMHFVNLQIHLLKFLWTKRI